MPLCLAMAMEFAPPRGAALTTGLLMTSYQAGGMAATGLGLTPAPAAGWRWIFWAGVLPAVIAVPAQVPPATRRHVCSGRRHWCVAVQRAGHGLRGHRHRLSRQRAGRRARLGHRSRTNRRRRRSLAEGRLPGA
ncbi:hypothetical protein ACIBVL_34560 [Streptomyces sp. NPDC049687]|uniref:hypothetical protein n=1 Tax=Streptomyces sp. NPDC049687 TaxID=3365596 RepID=UPI00379DAC13